MPIALLTDFGPASAYVGAMKGVIARLAPGMQVIDLAHDVPPQAVEQAGFVLAHSYLQFPEQTVFVCVVDPGVGTEREAVCLRAAERTFVAPAGPLLADVLLRHPEAHAWEITARELFLEDVSATFHGRDVFAPVAAHLAGGLTPERLGPSRRPVELIHLPAASLHGPTCGRVRMVDRFGNLVTDLAPSVPPQQLGALEVGAARIKTRARTFGEAPEDGTPFFYVGSYGTLEVGVRGGSAYQALGSGPGAAVRTIEKKPAQEALTKP